MQFFILFYFFLWQLEYKTPEKSETSPEGAKSTWPIVDTENDLHKLETQLQLSPENSKQKSKNIFCVSDAKIPIFFETGTTVKKCRQSNLN